MLIKRHRYTEPLPSEITPRALAASRRQFLQQLAAGGIAARSLSALGGMGGIGVLGSLSGLVGVAQANDAARARLNAKPNAAYVALDKPTAYKDATTYNNFYEFGLDKGDPAQYAGVLMTRAWPVRI